MHKQRAPDALRIERAQQAADDLDAVDLVAVDCRRYEHRRTGLRAVQHVHRQRDGGMIGQLGDGQVHQPTLTRLDGQSSDDERLPHGDAPLWRCVVLPAGRCTRCRGRASHGAYGACTVPATRVAATNVSTPNCASSFERRAPFAPPPRQRAPAGIEISLDVKKKRRFKAAMSARCLHPGRATFKTYRRPSGYPSDPPSRRASDLGSLTR